MPVAGALSGVLIWGLIWYPYRVLQEAGVSGTLATLITYLLAMLCGMVMLPGVWRELHPLGVRRGYKGVITKSGNLLLNKLSAKLTQPQQHTQPKTGRWVVLLVLSAGWTNFGYVLAVLYGEVMRVLLLFYLAPLWTILFSYWLLGERLNRYGYLVMSLSFSGAVVMLWEPQRGLPLPENFAEWIGLSAGMAFALSNVVSRRAAHLSLQAKSYSVWLGTSLLTALLLCWQGGLTDRLQAVSFQSWLLLGLLGIVLCCSTFALQYALANLSANRAIILFLFELVVAAISSYLLANETMQLRDWLGALLIVSAGLLSGKMLTVSKS
jgi:drug/metabolite transporter (DMT)-like permease